MQVTGEIYHVLNRGVESRVIFNNKRDYQRFLITLLECNSTDSDAKNRHRKINNRIENILVPSENKLVDILCLCLMPNHFHLAVKQIVDGGVAKFMQRVGNSYAKYFNIKNNRKGPLFISRYKSVHVSTDIQIRHLIIYIHANPLDLIMSKWRQGEVKDFKKAREYLENYKWSSYLFYAKDGNKSFASRIINPEMVNIFYPDKRDQLEAIKSWSKRYFEGDLE